MKKKVTMKKAIIFGHYNFLSLGRMKVHRLPGTSFSVTMEYAEGQHKTCLLEDINLVNTHAEIQTLPIRHYDLIAYVGNTNNPEFEEIKNECERSNVSLLLMTSIEGALSLLEIYKRIKGE